VILLGLFLHYSALPWMRSTFVSIRITRLADLRVMLEGGQMQAVRRAVSRMITSIEVKGAAVPERKLLEPRLCLHGNLAGLLALAAGKSARVVAGVGFVPGSHSEGRPLVAARWVNTPAKQGAGEMRRIDLAA
jgi:hypothetical protein